MTSPGAPERVVDVEDDFQLIDWQRVREWAGFVLRSTRRRRKLGLLAFAVAGALSVGVIAMLPRTYHVETQLLAQKNSLMPALGNPGRTVPSDADAPTRAAPETVLRRDNLVSLMKQTDLMRQWDLTRLPHLKLKDKLVTLLFGPPTEEERTTAVLEYLEKMLKVTTAESTVTIAIDWPNRDLAYRLVDAAQQNFLEQRHGVEVSAIAETITILEGHAASLKESIDAAMEDLNRVQATKPGRVARPGPAAPVVRRDPADEAARAEAAEVKVLLDTKRRAINELEDFRRRRLAELQSELVQKRAVYADAHPAVMTVLQSIASLQEDSPQLASMRAEEKRLQADYDRVAKSRPGAVAAPSPASESLRRIVPLIPVEDASGEMARTRLRFAMAKYDSILERIDSARIELETARAAFKYRYSVIRPPTLPKRPEKPNLPLAAVAGFLFSLLAAIGVTTLADVRSGQVLETWQVERLLGLEVLGGVPRSPPTLLEGG